MQTKGEAVKNQIANRDPGSLRHALATGLLQSLPRRFLRSISTVSFHLSFRPAFVPLSIWMNTRKCKGYRYTHFVHPYYMTEPSSSIDFDEFGYVSFLVKSIELMILPSTPFYQLLRRQILIEGFLLSPPPPDKMYVRVFVSCTALLNYIPQLVLSAIYKVL